MTPAYLLSVLFCHSRIVFLSWFTFYTFYFLRNILNFVHVPPDFINLAVHPPPLYVPVYPARIP